MYDEPGVYQLHLYLPKTARVKVGKRGAFLFPAGRYIYTGSALNGLESRLARHQRPNKTLHWHIDYFLRHARIERIIKVPTRQRLECALNREALAQPGAEVIVKGFGSSDCRCSAHLIYLRAGEPSRESVGTYRSHYAEPVVTACQWLSPRRRTSCLCSREFICPVPEATI